MADANNSLQTSMVRPRGHEAVLVVLNIAELPTYNAVQAPCMPRVMP